MRIMEWLKEEITKTPGYMRVNLSLLTILMISSVTSTCITNKTTGKKYIGRKYFVQKRKPRGRKEKSY